MEVASLIQNALQTAIAYQHHMERYLFESARLDGLEKLPVDGSLPASFLRYFRKVVELFDESTRLSRRQLRDTGLIVRCQSECPHCCYQMPTGVSTAELIYLYHGMQQSGAASRFFRRCLEAEELWVEVFRQQTNENPHRAMLSTSRNYSRNVTVNWKSAAPSWTASGVRFIPTDPLRVACISA